MDQKLPLHNTCEIGPLRKVLLHRPGRELENLMPEYLERLLFDDIPYLKLAQEEHDQFAATLRQCGVEVLYLTDLTAEAVADEGVRRQFIRGYLDEAGPPRPWWSRWRRGCARGNCRALKKPALLT